MSESGYGWAGKKGRALRKISVIFLALMLCVACNRATTGLKPGKIAPDFRANDLRGKTYYLNAELNKPIVLTFFATWCAPCKDEIPLLIDLQREYKNKVGILCIVTDAQNKDKAMSIAAGLSVPYPMLVDEGEKIMKLYEVDTLPTTLLIGSDGRIRSKYSSFRESELQSLKEQINRVLKK